MPQRKRRYAICIDDSVAIWLDLNHLYGVVADRPARDGELCVRDDDGDEHVVPAAAFLPVDLPDEYEIDDEVAEKRANRIMADALEADAWLQDRGESHRIGESYGLTFKRLLEVNPNFGDPIAFALGFWDGWRKAARGLSDRNADVTGAEWARFARSVARDVRRGIDPFDPELLDRLEP
jgi:hypothetical protein